MNRQPVESKGANGPEAANQRGVQEALGSALKDLDRVIDELRGVLGGLRSALGRAPEDTGRLRGALHKTRVRLRRHPKDEDGGAEDQDRQRTDGEQGQLRGDAPSGADRDEQQAAGASREQPETVSLFDGTEESFARWKTVGAGSFDQGNGELRLEAGSNRGLAYFASRRFDDFRVRLQYRLDTPEGEMGIALRFLDPEQPVPDRDKPEVLYPYDNQAYVAAHTGYEVRLGAPPERAGTFDGVPDGERDGAQSHRHTAQLKPGGWNDLEVEARGDEFTVRLNGAETARFKSLDGYRGRPARSGPSAGYVGVVMRSGKMAVRQVEAEILTGEAAREGAEPARKELDKEAKQKADDAAVHEEVGATLARLKARNPGLDVALQQAYAYAVFPSVSRGGVVLGAAHGHGEVFEQGKPIGFATLTQMTIGVQVGGQTFSEIITFDSPQSLDRFKRGLIGFTANASAVMVRGASGTSDYERAIVAKAYSRGGMLLEASLGAQKFKFRTASEDQKESQARHKQQGEQADSGRVRRAAQGLVSGASARVSSFVKAHRSQ